jgi:hypothetical protein
LAPEQRVERRIVVPRDELEGLPLHLLGAVEVGGRPTWRTRCPSRFSRPLTEPVSRGAEQLAACSSGAVSTSVPGCVSETHDEKVMAIARVRSLSSAPVSRMRSIHSFAFGRRLRIHQNSSRRHTASATVSTSADHDEVPEARAHVVPLRLEPFDRRLLVDPRSSGSTSLARPT